MRVDGAVVVIEARLSVNLNALTIERARPFRIEPPGYSRREQMTIRGHPCARARAAPPRSLPNVPSPRGCAEVIGKMRRSHEALLASLLQKLHFAGAPECCLKPLQEAQSRAVARGSEYFNEAALLDEATKEAISAKGESLAMLGTPSSWEADIRTSAPEPVAARLRSAAELLATEKCHQEAAGLLTLAVQVSPVPESISQRVEELCKLVIFHPTSSERSHLEALLHFMLHGADDPLHQPWPRTVRHLVKLAGDRDGVGIGFALARTTHRSPAAIVQPQLFKQDATAKARKGSEVLYSSSIGDVERIRAALVLCGPEGHVRESVNSSMDNGVTPLMLACDVGATDAVHALLAAHADPNVQSAHGCSALSLAVSHAHPGGLGGIGPPPLVSALLEAQADVNIGLPSQMGVTWTTTRKLQPYEVGAQFPLIAAVKQGSDSHQALLALLRNGADVNAQDGLGLTALMRAVRNNKCVFHSDDRTPRPLCPPPPPLACARPVLALTRCWMFGPSPGQWRQHEGDLR